MDMLNLGAFPPMSEMSPLALAFLGDGVYGLLVREHLLQRGNCTVNRLHTQSVEWVRCEAQAQALRRLWPALSAAEQAIAQRGRNAHVHHVPKNSSLEDYHSATALETLFGALYIQGEFDRIRALFMTIAENE